MALIGTTLIDDAAFQLLDIDNIKWTRTELLRYLNEAQKQIVVLAPAANATVANVSLVAGPKQTLPAGAWTLLDVYHNVATNGEARRAVHISSRRLMSAFNPDWMTDASQAEVKSVIYDEQDRNRFWVYPPNTGVGILSCSYATVPALLATEADTLTVNDSYYTALVEFMLFRACSKAAPFSPGPEEAQKHFNLFVAAVAAKQAGEGGNSPNAQDTAA